MTTPTDQLHQPLQNHDGEGTGTEHIEVPRGYYVIIGRGAAALFNHACLLYDGQDLSSGSAKSYDWGKKHRLGWQGGATPELPIQDQFHQKAAVMHIGFVEPWGRRKLERMGQIGLMLNLFRHVCPEASLPPDGGPEFALARETRDWLESKRYHDMLTQQVGADATPRSLEAPIRSKYKAFCGRTVGDRRQDELKNNPNTPQLVVLEGFVGTIERRDSAKTADREEADGTSKPLEPFLSEPERVWWEAAQKAENPVVVKGAKWLNMAFPYRINVWRLVDDGGKADCWFHEHVYAYKIDICTGVLPVLFVGKWTKWADAKPDSQLEDEDLWKELTNSALSDPWKPMQRAPVRRVLTGMDFIGAPIDKESVLIEGGNPVGAQCVQYACELPGRGDLQYFEGRLPGSDEVVDCFHHARTGPQVTWCTWNHFAMNQASLPGDRNLIEVMAHDCYHPGDPSLTGDRDYFEDRDKTRPKKVEIVPGPEIPKHDRYHTFSAVDPDSPDWKWVDRKALRTVLHASDALRV
jgi:hypothetical protein